MNMTLDKRKIILIALLVTVPLLILISVLNAPSALTIESDQGATLSVSDTKDGDFKKIGVSKVTHLFIQKPTNIYVSAELNGKQTISVVTLKRLSNKKITLRLSDTVTAKKISDGAVVDAIFSGNKGRGIAYEQNTLVDFTTDAPTIDLNPELVGLPYIDKVIWSDINNFVYLSDDGIGQFVGGINKSDTEVGSVITGDVTVDAENATQQGAPRIIDISKTGDNPLVLLSNSNIFTSSNMGTRMNAIVSYEAENRETAVFTTADSIFKVTYPELEHTDVEDASSAQITVDEYSYSGEEKGTLFLDDDSTVVNIVKKDDTTYVLTQAGLHAINDSNIQKQDLYFATPADMVIYNNEVVVLAKDGLWKIGNDNTFQLLFKFTGKGTSLPGSMSVEPNGQLIFGTTPTESTSNTATFSLSL